MKAQNQGGRGGWVPLAVMGGLLLALSPGARRWIWQLVEDAAAAEYKAKRLKILEERKAAQPLPPPSNAPLAYTPPMDEALAHLVDHPSIVLILGRRGSGKSALALRLQELLRDIAPPYGVGLPAQVNDLLPEWYGLANDPLALPSNAIIYIPESYRLFHARTTQSTRGRAIGGLVNLSRHRQQTLIFDVQNAAHLDRNIISEADLVLVKEPGPFQQGFERSELRSVMDGARAAFAAVGERRKKRAVWVATAADAGHGQLMENQLPTFWSNALSTVFGTGGLQEEDKGPATATPRRGRATSKEAKRQKAREMKAGGYSYSEIAKALGVSKSYAYKLVNDQAQGQAQTPANSEDGGRQSWTLDDIGRQIKRTLEQGGIS